MSKKRLVKIVGVFCIITMFAVLVPVAKADSCCPSSPKQSMSKSKAASEKGHHGHTEKTQVCPASDKSVGLEKLHSEYLLMLSKTIDKALNAIESGDKKTASIELKKAKKMIAMVNGILNGHTKPGFINVKCPIMGSPINPDKVAKGLIRDYKGQKVAFCCGGCPESWDKLSATEKEAKLAKVKPASVTFWTCSMHPEVKMPKPGLCPKCNMTLIPAKK